MKINASLFALLATTLAVILVAASTGAQGVGVAPGVGVGTRVLVFSPRTEANP